MTGRNLDNSVSGMPVFAEENIWQIRESSGGRTFRALSPKRSSKWNRRPKTWVVPGRLAGRIASCSSVTRSTRRCLSGWNTVMSTEDGTPSAGPSGSETRPPTQKSRRQAKFGSSQTWRPCKWSQKEN